MQSELRQQKRARIAKAAKLYKMPAGKFEPVDLTKREHPAWMTRAYMNNRYVVMINDNAGTDKGKAIRAMVQRHDDTPIPGIGPKCRKLKTNYLGLKPQLWNITLPRAGSKMTIIFTGFGFSRKAFCQFQTER